jgi:hypothetical protein
MAKRSVRIRAEDILEAIDGAQEILDARDFGAYQKNLVFVRGLSDVSRSYLRPADISQMTSQENIRKLSGTA